MSYIPQIRQLLEKGWCNNAHALDDTGAEVHIDDPRATNFSLITAIYHVVPQDAIEGVYAQFMSVLGLTEEHHLLDWANSHDRTETLELLNRVENP